LVLFHERDAQPGQQTDGTHLSGAIFTDGGVVPIDDFGPLTCQQHGVVRHHRSVQSPVRRAVWRTISQNTSVSSPSNLLWTAAADTVIGPLLASRNCSLSY
jgi:hypothetical protein